MNFYEKNSIIYMIRYYYKGTPMKNALITGKVEVSSLKALFDKLQEELSLLDVQSFIVDPKEKHIPHQDFDIIFSIGGDGSFVSTARKYVDQHVPIVAVKAGTIGFLPNLDPQHFKRDLPNILRPNNQWTTRMLLCGSNDQKQELVALNEFLFSTERKGSLCELTICINGDQVMRARSDGLLIASPTGSTAYNLSAGGPISLPDMELITITPVCSHILGERPLVIGLNNSIQIINSSNFPARIWADGQDSIPFAPNEVFTINKTKYINSLYTTSTDFFNTLSRKLGWRLGHLKDQT